MLAQGCGLATVAGGLAALIGRPANRVRERLREWDREATAQRGAQRQERVVSHCFAPLLR